MLAARRLALLLAWSLAVCSALGGLGELASQEEALAYLAAGDKPKPTEEDVILMLDRGWWDAAKGMLREMRQGGAAVGSMQEVRGAATRIRDQATEIINLMRVGANAEETVVNAAFQWAQRPEFIYLNVKFSSRIDGPVTVLNVDNENVTLTNDTLLFDAIGRQKPKTFRLNLTFNRAIDPERSSWSFASVGRISFTIAKAVPETWPRLLLDKKKPKNMYAWYERQTVLDEEVKKEAAKRKEAEKAEKEAKEKAEKEAAEKAKDPNPPGAPPPVDAPPESESTGEGAAAGKKKKKKKKKARKAQKKDEM